MECKVGEPVKVYKKKWFPKKLQEIMYGTIVNVEKWIYTGAWGDNEIECYKVTIDIEGKEIVICDNFSRILFRRYEFEICKY